MERVDLFEGRVAVIERTAAVGGPVAIGGCGGFGRVERDECERAERDAEGEFDLHSEKHTMDAGRACFGWASRAGVSAGFFGARLIRGGDFVDVIDDQDVDRHVFYFLQL